MLDSSGLVESFLLTSKNTSYLGGTGVEGVHLLSSNGDMVCVLHVWHNVVAPGSPGIIHAHNLDLGLRKRSMLLDSNPLSCRKQCIEKGILFLIVKKNCNIYIVVTCIIV